MQVFRGNLRQILIAQTLKNDFQTSLQAFHGGRLQVGSLIKFNPLREPLRNCRGGFFHVRFFLGGLFFRRAVFQKEFDFRFDFAFALSVNVMFFAVDRVVALIPSVCSRFGINGNSR